MFQGIIGFVVFIIILAGINTVINPHPTSEIIPAPLINTNQLISPTDAPVENLTPSPTVKPAAKIIPIPTIVPTSIPIQIDAPCGTYINSAGQTITSPCNYPRTPSGASAICGDGTYSFSQSRRGTCSHHGGVAQWL